MYRLFAKKTLVTGMMTTVRTDQKVVDFTQLLRMLASRKRIVFRWFISNYNFLFYRIDKYYFLSYLLLVFKVRVLKLIRFFFWKLIFLNYWKVGFSNYKTFKVFVECSYISFNYLLLPPCNPEKSTLSTWDFH